MHFLYFATQRIIFKIWNHFLQNIIVGAKCEYFSSTNQLEYHKSVDITTIAEMSYKRAIFKISGSEEMQYGSTIDEFNKHSSIILNVYGGKPEYGKYISKEGNYEKWIELFETNIPKMYYWFGCNRIIKS